VISTSANGSYIALCLFVLSLMCITLAIYWDSCLRDKHTLFTGCIHKVWKKQRHHKYNKAMKNGQVGSTKWQWMQSIILYLIHLFTTFYWVLQELIWFHSYSLES